MSFAFEVGGQIRPTSRWTDSFEVADVFYVLSSTHRYRELLDRTYVDDNPNLKWCPHPDCQFACYTSQAPPRKLNQIIPTVMCRCGHDFCFGCGFADDHRPLICKYVKLWEKKCADDSETSNWLMANTKECAKCASTIEKNGGCK